ncbi:MAG TPA: hypothetical protein VF518_01405, partial [Polyangia bacterium]
IGLVATVDLRSHLHRGLFLSVSAVLVVFLAFTWTNAFGLQALPDRLEDWEWSQAQVTQFPMTAAGVLPWVLALFVISRSILDRGQRIGVEILGACLLVAAVAVNASPFPAVGILGGATAIAATLLAYGNARISRGDTRLMMAHLLGIGTATLLGNLGGTAVALAAVGAYALVLMVLRSTAGFWLGMTGVLLSTMAALAHAETRWLSSALLALFGLVLLLPRPNRPQLTAAIPLPALVFSLLIALFYAGASETPHLGTSYLFLVLLVALLPATLWIAIGRAPFIILVEVLLGMAVAAVGGNAIWVFVATLAFLAGRNRRARQVAAIAFFALAGLAIYQEAPRSLLIAALGIAGGLCLGWRLAGEDRFVRWLAMPGLLAALMAGGFYGGSAEAWLPPELAPPLFFLGLAPFFTYAVLRRKPDFVVIQSVLGLVLTVVAGLLVAWLHRSGLPSAVAAGLASLALLIPTEQKAEENSPVPHIGLDTRWLAIPGFLTALLLGGFTNVDGMPLWPAKM